MAEKLEKVSTEGKKWQAGPGTVFCRRGQLDTGSKSIIHMPGEKPTNDVLCYTILSVGPDVEGYHEGDVILVEKGSLFSQGAFVRVRDILGRLVPESAPNSAIAVPRNGAETVREMSKAD